MFEAHNAKRIKRSELFHDDNSSQSSSRSTSPVAASNHRDEPTPSKPDYGFDYEFISPSSAPAPPLETESTRKEEANNEEGDKEEEYHFRLFTSSTPKQPSQPIRLSPTPPPTNPTEPPSLDETNFIRPHRPDSYYFASALPPGSVQALKAEFATVAMSTADVVSLSTSTKWPGTALPWRCIHVQLINPTKAMPSRDPGRGRDAISQNDSATDTKRTGRPSKKRRILLRKRLALRANLVAQAQQSEEAEREKRTRRNREKKVKRKEREKRKKSMGSDAAQGTGGTGPTKVDEDHSMPEDEDIDLPHARPAMATATATPTAIVEAEQPPPRTPATKEEQLPDKGISNSSGAGTRPNEAIPKARPGAGTPPKSTIHSAPPTAARRAAPTSRAPTARAAVS